MMRRMTGDTGHVIDVVLGTIEVGMLFAILMASKAALAYVFCFSALENENLAFIAARLDVSFARTMAGFAPLPFRTTLGERGLEMRGGLKVFENVFVASFTRLGPNVISRTCG
jgi:hypothetical protein